MTKSELLSELERLKGDPEIEIRNYSEGRVLCPTCDTPVFLAKHFTIDRINEFPSPEIIIIEK